jgi:hypothetical protein
MRNWLAGLLTLVLLSLKKEPLPAPSFFLFLSFHIDLHGFPHELHYGCILSVHLSIGDQDSLTPEPVTLPPAFQKSRDAGFGVKEGRFRFFSCFLPDICLYQIIR